MFNKRGQIWIETVIYTLIGLVIIGVLLAVIKPKIDSMKDKAVIDQALEALQLINQKIDEVRIVAGNARPVDIFVKRGLLVVDGNEESIGFVLEDSSYEYSESGLEVDVNGINVSTEKGVKKYKVVLKLNYENFDLTYNGENKIKEFQASPTAYRISVINNGAGSDGKTMIDISY